ncbi:substrate-binding periplasmic protein [Noviherbaspirillum cavernae]|uniref:substrate-binding periplasmic protein n=1 Tax=Noviherbaspirillum cavernae TaxID=2320862 RepID=UPI001313D9D3|nr:transporter substrate-binding domain-containing protein [Noviherbaspirillum cavernae]
MLDKLRKHRAASLAALALAGAAQPASAVTQLRTAAQEGTDPKYIAAAPGGSAITGLCIDILRAIERVEPDVKFVGDQNWMPLARIEAELAAGAQDAAPCLVKNPERDARLVFIEPPLYQISFVLAARANDPIQVSGWPDVRNLGPDGVVLVMKSSGAINRVNKDGTGILFDAEAKTPELNLRKLAAGRGRFFYHRTPGLKREISRAGLDGKIRILAPAMEVTPAYLVLGRHVSKEVTDKVRRAVSQLHASGELARIFQKWDGE